MDDLLNKDPSQLTDEELDAVLNGERVEDPKDPPEDPKPGSDDPKDPPSQDPPEDPQDPKDDPKDPPVEDPKDPPADPKDDPQDPKDPKPADDPKDPPAPSPREARRIQALIAKMKNGQQAAPVAQPAPTPPVEVKPINFRELIDAPDEVYATLERAAEEYGKSFTPAPAPVQQAPQAQNVDPTDSLRWEMGLKIDTPRVLAKYDQLNPESPKFDPVVADAINMEYLHTVGFDETTGLVANPAISYPEYVEARFELANLLAKEQVQTSTKNVVKQAATTGLRPDGSQSKRLNLNQAPENMTDEELDAIIGQAIPQR